MIISSCQKTGLEPKDIVHAVLSKMSSLSKIALPEDYSIIRSEYVTTGEQDLMTATLSLNTSYIAEVSDQFRSLRRHSAGPGYGKVPGGWEFYCELKEKEQYKMIIDTFSNQLTICHRIQY
jgi:hypothetical protein